MRAAPPLHFLEPAASAAWAPFHGVRPVAELRAGAWPVRERWTRLLEAAPAAIVGDALAGFHEFDEPPIQPTGPIAGPAIVVRSDFAPALAEPAPLAAGVRRLVHSGTTVAWVVPAGETWQGPEEPGPAGGGGADAAREVAGLLLRGAFDLVTALERLLADDVAQLARDGGDPLPAGSVVLGDAALVVARGALIEPGVVFDVRKGAIVLEANVEVRAGARLEGPLYAGRGTRLLGGPIANAVFGPRCNARGEISTSVFTGYCNKGHDGFVGHSVLGHWVNLGAGTTTSNLKNTYGEVRLDVGRERLATGRTNLGTLFGDHAKTAIGTMLATGTVVGAGANLFGAAGVPKWVPPMAWGNELRERLTEDGFLKIATRVLPRRDVEVTDARRASLAAIYRRATAG
ncbi:MAG TPA: putative sugar nucleotidyl transferase [Gemmatimonadales bacterium]|nr:putative sugar nucleotidyl transferase [Gemmatimonadales bacterium]